MNRQCYSSQPFLQLVDKYADQNGKVDYANWQQSADDLKTLEEQVKMLAQVSPANRPDLFADESAVRSYWINTYNTLVLHAVLDLWPLTSVRDVKISLGSRFIPGKGFFYDRKVVVGGFKTSLYQLENNIIRRQLRDPRVHFALNCASGSCPILKPSDWSEADLETAASDFINNPANVMVDARAVRLSRIFKWYKKDFPDDLLRYLQGYADDALHGELQLAIEKQYKTDYFAYDWQLNTTLPGKG